jgi:hypothetical protein
MSKYYNGKRTRNIYDPDSKEPFRLSRSKIDLFVECPRCFYLDRRMGIGRPPGYPFSLNVAVDTLLKKEFDTHRCNKTAHPLMKAFGLDAVPLAHEKMKLPALTHGVSRLRRSFATIQAPLVRNPQFPAFARIFG